MLKLVLTLILSVFLCSFANAQEFTIKGKVVDATNKTILEGTTIYAETSTDSTLITYTITDQNGFFELEGKTNSKDFNLIFSFTGYKTLKLSVKNKLLTDLGTVDLEEQSEELKGVQVTADRIPMTIKKDTVEFNADSFKTRPDANVEDVLKKLPGVEVDADGKITVNGKEVNQVLVNGQVFFSTDPTVATKSLPKEIIDKIQITNTKTKEQEFTGEDGDGETKTINLTIKEDKNKGYLGRFGASYGTDDRYQANGFLNYFNNKKRVSAIAGSNNINNTGFSFDEISDIAGNAGGAVLDFGRGITTSSLLGTSYADQEKGKYEISGNYLYTNSESFNDQRTSRENILPDRSFFTDTESNFNGTTNGHEASAELEFDIDKTLRISIEPSLSVNTSTSINNSVRTSTNEAQELINSNEIFTVNNNERSNFRNELTIFKRLDTIGKYLRFSFRNVNNKNQNLGNLNSIREVFGANPNQEVLDQETSTDNKTDNYQFSVRYRQPLTKILFLDFGYEYQNNQQDNLRSVFDFDELTNEYSAFNETLSSDFKFNNEQQIPSLGFRANGEKLRLRLNAEYIDTQLKNNDNLQNASFDKSYNNFLFSANINYRLDRSKRVSLRYNSNLDLPSVTQLQPIPNVNNPLNIVTGNPNLSPAVNHRISANYDNYSWKDRTGFFLYVGMNIEDNRVTQVTITDEDFLRTTTFTNINGNSSVYGGFGYSKEIKKDSAYSIKVNIRPNFNLNTRVGFTNGERLVSENLIINPRISTTFNFRELVEIEPEYTVSFDNTSFNLENRDNINFVSHNLKLRTTTYWPKNLIFANDIAYNYNGNVGADFDKDAIFWNMSLGYQFMDKNAIIKVLAYDLLNQNINTRRTSGDDFIQDFQGTVLQQYFMLSFSYKFDQFGGKSPSSGRSRRYN